MPVTSFVEYEYSNRDGAYCTRITKDGKGRVLVVERVHLSERPDGGTGDVDGILQQTAYGVPIWGGSPRPIITYDFKQQTVTKHSRSGDRVYSAKEFGSADGFEITPFGNYPYGQVLGFWEPQESTRVPINARPMSEQPL